MYEFEEIYLEAFIANQEQLFSERVANTLIEADIFLSDCMAEIMDSIEGVQEFLEEMGMDVVDMTPQELKEAAEVFEMPDGKFLVVAA